MIILEATDEGVNHKHPLIPLGSTKCSSSEGAAYRTVKETDARKGHENACDDVMQSSPGAEPTRNDQTQKILSLSMLNLDMRVLVVGTYPGNNAMIHIGYTARAENKAKPTRGLCKAKLKRNAVACICCCLSYSLSFFISSCCSPVRTRRCNVCSAYLVFFLLSV